jgi:hypothetical protein
MSGARAMFAIRSKGRGIATPNSRAYIFYSIIGSQLTKFRIIRKFQV